MYFNAIPVLVIVPTSPYQYVYTCIYIWQIAVMMGKRWSRKFKQGNKLEKFLNIMSQDDMPVFFLIIMNEKYPVVLVDINVIHS